MKRTIIVMCTLLWVMAVHAQYDERDRVVTINPLRNGDGSFVKANNSLFYNNTAADTAGAKKRMLSTPINNDPFAFRVRSVQALCNLNSLQLNWTSIQPQTDADYFDIQKTSDAGITWKSIGTVPAIKNKTGEAAYNFNYNKSLENVDLRVVAVNTAGERRNSAIIHSACNMDNLLSVDNLVYSTANLRIGSPKTQNIKLVLTNQSGLPVQTREAGLTQGVNSISLDMSHLTTGYYILTIIWPEGRQESVKMMKQ